MTPEELNAIMDSVDVGSKAAAPSVQPISGGLDLNAIMDAVDAKTLPEETAIDYGLGLVSAPIRGLTFGFGDEAIAGLGSLGALFTDETVPDAYNRVLSQQRDTEKQFAERHPYQNMASEIGGAILGTAAAPAIKGASLLGPVGESVLKGSAAGAAYGFGTGEGDASSRLKSAVVPAAVGAGAGIIVPAAGAALEKGADLAGKIGSQFEQAALGVRTTDLKKALKTGAGRFEQETTGQNPLLGSIDRLKKTDLFDGGFAPDDLLDKSKSSVEALQTQLRGVLNDADTAISGQAKVYPTFNNAQSYVDGLTGTDKLKMQKLLDAEVDQLMTSDLDGTLTSIHDAKVSFNRKAYATEEARGRAELDRKIAQDLKESVERNVNNLAQSGTLPADYDGIVKSLNQQQQDYYRVSPIFERRAIESQAANPVRGLINTLKTTGGTLTTPTIIGAGLGNGPLGLLAGAALTAANIPKNSWTLGQAARSIGSALEAANSPALFSIAPKLAADVASQVQQSEDLPQFSIPEMQKVEQTPKPTVIAAPKPVSAKKSDVSPVSYSPYDDVPLDSLLNAIADQESGGVKGDRNKAKSPKGAMGMFQFMPATAKAYGIDPTDPIQARDGAKRMMGDLIRQFGDIELALAAYNWGSGNLSKLLKKHGASTFDEISKFLPKETRNYVPGVLNRLDEDELVA